VTETHAETVHSRRGGSRIYSWLKTVQPLINKDFRACYLMLASGNLASANLNHQKQPRATKL